MHIILFPAEQDIKIRHVQSNVNIPICRMISFYRLLIDSNVIQH